jgi:hypothetical protein
MYDPDREKLVKLLRMFSSTFDGEVANAARRAHELIKSRALDWDDLLVRPNSNGGTQQHQEAPRYESGGSLDDIRHCQEFGEYLTEWEASFIDSIESSIQRWGHLTDKQQAVLDRVIAKLKQKGVWDGPAW